MADLLLDASTLDDRVGHRLMFTLSLVFFGPASIFTALAPSAGMLIVGAARLLLARR